MSTPHKLLSRTGLPLLLLVFTFIFAAQSANAQCGCTHIIPLNPSVYTVDGATFKAINGTTGVKPGDKVCFASGTRPDLLIKNMVGTAAQPITFTNMCDGAVTIKGNNYYTTGRLIIMSGCSYVHVTGAANPAVQYGIEITNGVQGIDFRDYSTRMEADHVFIHDISYSAFNAKTDPNCDPASWRGNGFILRDAYFHDNYVKNTLGEGFYIGDSHYHTTFPVTCNGVVIQTQETSIMGVEIAYNRLENIGRDGIQVGSGVPPDALSKIQGVFIHHNTINGFGATNEYAQQSGLQINPGTDTECYNNIVDSGTGFALFAGGEGGSHFYNNVLANALQGGIICASYIPYDPTGFIFSNNLLLNNSVYGIYMLAENATQPNLFVNNIIVANPAETGFLYVRLNNPPAIKWTDANNIKTTNLASLKFVNAAAKDYHLLLGSPAIDQGQDMSTHKITFDLDDKSRPKGTKFDIGPFEFIPSGPKANAGVDQVITLPTNTVTLPGTGTSATGITQYAWVEKSGLAVTLANAGTATLTVSNMPAGTYVFQLTVTDASGSDFDDVMVTVQNAAVNQAPTANAGVDKIITLPTNSVTLNGIGTDPDGSIASYSWAQTSGTAATLANQLTANLTVTNLVQGSATFSLTVKDNAGATSTDAAIVTVNPAATNQLPLVNAGTDKTVFLPASTTTLTATASDPDGTISTIAWTKKSGGTVTLGPTNGLSLSLSALTAGVYVFRCTVTDNSGGQSFDEVQVTVIAANQAPTANAGVDQSITLPTSTITLPGTGVDPDGTISSYAWNQVSGPNTATLSGGGTQTLTASGLVQGTYVFGLTVTDNSAATGFDQVSVFVSVAATANQPPVAFAGGNHSFSLPTNSVNLYGSGFDPDGAIVSYAWTKSSGGVATLANADKPTLTVTGLAVGLYTFTLTVTDDKGAQNSDIAIVTVSDAGTNISPVADAGQNKIIRLPQSSLTLDGKGTDADGTIASYAWSEVSGAAALISTPLAASTFISGLTVGDYVFRLMVTDNKGASDFDDVTIHVVNAANNLPPIVNAGPDLTIFLPASTATINATATDDGTIVSYTWLELSGPTVTMADPSVLKLQLSNLVQGVYSFQLTVKDDAGAEVFDIMNITVVPASFQPPTVSAGANQKITLPTNFINLTGSASSSNGTIQSLQWAQVSGPNTATLANDVTTTVAVTNMVAGTYIFKLTATDNNSLSASANVQVIVNPVPPNQLPNVNPGPNQAIKVPASTVTLTGTATDPDGTVASVKWTQTSGPNTATLANVGTLILNASNLIPGTYIFRLTATDNLGADGFGEAVVLVSDPAVTPDQPPVAFAGADVTLTLPDNSVTINGGGASVDGTITNYAWSQIGGSTATFLADTSVLNITALTQGSYTFELSVTDSNNKTGADSVTVFVVEKGSAFGIPKFFSPNNDGSNDVWVIKNIDTYKQCKLTIFSRSGQVVYEAAPYANTWDGTYNGRQLADGDYYYNMKCNDGNSVNGAVRIIR